MKSIRGVNVKNKVVLVRVDYNVPIKNGKVVDQALGAMAKAKLEAMLTGAM